LNGFRYGISIEEQPKKKEGDIKKGYIQKESQEEIWKTMWYFVHSFPCNHSGSCPTLVKRNSNVSKPNTKKKAKQNGLELGDFKPEKRER
jgi:hypothetical protein